MFDIGWTELLVIGVVALIVVGPKDLPGMFRVLGNFTAKARGMAREFQRSLETAAEESGVGDIASDLKKATSIKNLGLDSVRDVAKDLASSTFDIDRDYKKPVPAKTAADAGKNTKKLAAKRAASRKSATDKAAEKPAAKKTPAKKPAAMAKTAKKPAAKKPAAKATATKKSPAQKSTGKSGPRPKAKS